MYGGAAMEDQFWNLFRETGDPMGYLLYKAEKEKKKKEKNKPEPKPPAGPPPASA